MRIYKKYLFLILIIALIFTAYSRNWTVMVYMNGDNAGEFDTGYDFDELEAFGSTDEVKVVALWDTNASYAQYLPKHTPYLVEVVRDETYPVHSLQFTSAFTEKPELDMADGDTLVDFVRECVQKWPADHYMLIMYDKYSDGNGVNTITTDFTDSFNRMTLKEFRDAMREIRNTVTGRELDILMLESDHLMMAELQRELVGTVQYILGSEGRIRSHSFDLVLAYIFLGEHDVEGICRNIVNQYIADYEDRGQGFPNLQYACADVNLSQNIPFALFNLSRYAYTNWDDVKRDFIEVHNNTLSLETYNNLDLYEFCKRLSGTTQHRKLRYYALDVCNAIEKAVYNVTTVHNDPEHPDYTDGSKLNGVSVYFPAHKSYYDRNQYWELDFIYYSYWVLVLDRYFGIEYKPSGKQRIRIPARTVKFVKAVEKDGKLYTGEKAEENIVGYYPYMPHQDEYYQLYIDFDLGELKKEKIKITDAMIMLWPFEQKNRVRNIIAVPENGFTGRFMEKSELSKLSGCRYEERAIKGDKVKELALEYYNQNTNKGLIIGYGAEFNKDFGYLKGFSEDQIYMTIEYEFEEAQ